jgi:hypothetical protein
MLAAFSVRFQRCRGFIFKAHGKLIGEQLERPHITKKSGSPFSAPI